MLGLLLYALCISQTMCLIQVAPTWITSHYIQADHYNVISTKTGNTSTPTATMTFAKQFQKIPNLGYGSAAYIGLKCLIQETISSVHNNLK